MVWLVMMVCSVAVLQLAEGDPKAVETGLLRLLGMQKRPRAVPSLSAVPEDMLQLYKQQTGLDIDTPFFKLPGRMTRSANTVRRFTHSGKEEDNRKKRHDRFRLFFNISEMPKNEKVTAAEIKLTIVGGEFAQRVLVHDILKPGVKGKRPPLLRLLDTSKISIKEGGTIVMDVLPAAERWALHPKQNYGLLIEITTKKGAKPKHNKIRVKRDLNHHSLLLYLDDGKNRQPTLEQMLSRKKRAQTSKKHRRKDGRDICRRHQLYVDFKDVGWDDWIVAPPGYEAYYCHGDCPFPLADHLNSTNHAVVQTLVNSVNPSSVPTACCIPTQLSSISMLYVDEENIVLKNYQDMAVVGCGCR